tara:strand:+ start:6346 stop:10113 length:3768 start_codon:yes stop_codon:yes gene_type:complete
MANSYVDFVKKYAKDNNIKYGEALKKSKDAWKKHKESKGITTKSKPKKKVSKVSKVSKTTEKSKSKADLKKESEMKNLINLAEKDSNYQISRLQIEQEKKLVKALTDSSTKMNERVADLQLLGYSLADAKKEAKLQSAKARAKVKLMGGKLNEEPKENIKMKVESIKFGDQKKQRTKLIKEFNKLNKELKEKLSNGTATRKDIDNFNLVAKPLRGESKTNRYAKLINKYEKEFVSKKFSKVKTKMTKAQLRQLALSKNLETQLTRDKGFSVKRGEMVAQRKVFNIRVNQLKRMGATDEEAEVIAKEEQRQKKEQQDIEKELLIYKHRSGNKGIGMDYSTFIKGLAKTKKVSYEQAQKINADGNLYKKQLIKDMKATSSVFVKPSVQLSAKSMIGNISNATPILQNISARSKYLKKDGTLKAPQQKQINQLFTLLGKDNVSKGSNDMKKLHSILKNTTKARDVIKKLEVLRKLPSSAVPQNEIDRLNTLYNQVEDYVDTGYTVITGKKVKRTGSAISRSASTSSTTSTSLAGPATTPPQSPKPKPKRPPRPPPPPVTPRKGKGKAPVPAPTLPPPPTPIVPPLPTPINPPNLKKIVKVPKEYYKQLGQMLKSEPIATQLAIVNNLVDEGGIMVDGSKVAFGADDNAPLAEIISDLGNNVEVEIESQNGGGGSGAGLDLNETEEGGALELKRKLKQIKMSHNKFFRAIQDIKGTKKNVKTQGAIDSQDKKYLDMSDSAYNPPNDRQQKIYGFIYNKNASNDEHAIYVNQNEKKIVIAFRGSQTKEDWLKTDTNLSVGKLKQTPRFGREEKWVQEIKSMLPNYQYVYTGHSLGGTLAIEMGDLFKEPAITFNAGHGVGMGDKSDNDVKFYSAKGDAVSTLGVGKYKDTRLIENSAGNSITAHSLDAFKSKEDDGFASNATSQDVDINPKLSEIADKPIAETDDDPQGQVENKAFKDIPTAETGDNQPTSPLPTQLEVAQQDLALGTLDARDVNSATDDWGVGGAFMNLVQKKSENTIDDINHLHSEYSPPVMKAKVNGFKTLHEFKNYKDDFQHKINSLLVAINELKHHNNRIEDTDIKKSMVNHIKELEHQVHYARNQIHPLLNKSIEQKFSNRLNNDNRSLGDIVVKGKNSLLEKVKSNDSKKEEVGGFLKIRSDGQIVRNRDGFGKRLGQSFQKGLKTNYDSGSWLDRMLLKLVGYKGGSLVNKIQGGNLTNNDHKEIINQTGMPLNQLRNIHGGRDGLHQRLNEFMNMSNSQQL